MAIGTMTRPAMTTTTPCSAYVREGAIRLFTEGYLGKLLFDHQEGDHFYYQIPSESQPGVVYGIDFDPFTGIIRCSCPAGQHNVPCKHVEAFRLSRGFVNREGRA
jgi:hypothetical protein